MSEENVLRIERIASGGDGIARRSDGCVVFVPRTAVGDLVEVEYTEEHRQWRRARLVHVIEPGPDRRDAPCPHYARCGGCQLQHMGYDAQLVAKTSMVLDCLQRLGGVKISQLEIEPSPREFAYRNRISLVARHVGAKLTAGYHALEAPDDVVDVFSCPLAEEAINTVWAPLRDILEGTASLKENGAGLRLTLRANARGQVGLAIERLSGRGAIRIGLDALQAVPGLDAVWHVARGRIIAQAGREQLSEEWGAYRIPVSGTTFLQVNRDAAAILDRYVIDQCGRFAGEHAVDAYCGLGLRALELAKNEWRVTGIDVDRLSITTASRLATETGLNAVFVSGAVEHKLRSNLPADVVILNPPRRGVGGVVTDLLAARPPAGIVYVSCDPATLARDIRALGGQFELTECRAFDLFPQTAHVETVATLLRRGDYLPNL